MLGQEMDVCVCVKLEALMERMGMKPVVEHVVFITMAASRFSMSEDGAMCDVSWEPLALGLQKIRTRKVTRIEKTESGCWTD